VLPYCFLCLDNIILSWLPSSDARLSNIGGIEISILLTEQTISIPPILESRASEEGSHERMILSRHKKQ
jgi:hypothetical protein